MIQEVLVAMVAVLAFSIFFSAPRQYWIFCSLVGGLSWVVNSVLLSRGISPILACFFATLTLTFFSRLFSVWRRAPAIVFLIAGIFPLVPGAGIYYTANFLFMGDLTAGLYKGVETLKFAGAIALGILFGLSLPARLFRWAAPRANREKSGK